MLFCIYSCTDNKNSNPELKTEIPIAYSNGNKPGATYQDTLRIKGIRAVFFSPDSIQLEKLKSTTDTIVFSSMQHDCFYQMRNASLNIKKYYPHARMVEAKKFRYLLFEMKNGGKEIIDLNSNNDPCGIYLFDGIKKPLLTDMTNIETALGDYFKK